MLSDMPDITLRPTERINPAVEANGLPALFSMAPTSLDMERGLLPVSEPPPSVAEPFGLAASLVTDARATAAPAADPRDASLPPVVAAHAPNGMYDDAPQISVRPAYASAPHVSALPRNGTHAEPLVTRGEKSMNGQHANRAHLGDPTSVAPALYAIDAHSAAPAAAPVRPEPRTDAAAESELPAADGWRPVERTEPALPLSRRGDNELRRLAEALPSIPPAVEPPAHPAAASVLASAEVPATKSVTEVPPPFAPKTNTVPIPALEQPLAAVPASPVAALAVDSLQGVSGRLSQTAPNVDVRLSEAASCEPIPQPSLPAPVFVPETCNAVAPTLLVACRPASLRPRHYACSPAGGR